jgi:predicted chitinase
MARSQSQGPKGFTPHGNHIPENLPGPIGSVDASKINFMELYRDSPGPLGVNDWAEVVALGNIDWHLPGKPFSMTDPIPERPSVLGCACGRDLSIKELCLIYSKSKRQTCEQYLPLLNSTFKAYGITSCMRKAHFLAQIGHESGELRYSAEQLAKGKTESKLYHGYKGRGLIQITWRKGYMAYGKAVHHDFLDQNKVQLEQPEWAADSAGWFWTKGPSGDLNSLADVNDFLAITAKINGAFNGFEDRKFLLKSSFTVLKVNQCKTLAVRNQNYLPFSQSAIYQSKIHSFAWGCWNDNKAGKTGVLKSESERKQAYLRFLELSKNDALNKHPGKTHFGFTPDKMHALAVEGSK